MNVQLNQYKPGQLFRVLKAGIELTEYSHAGYAVYKLFPKEDEIITFTGTRRIKDKSLVYHFNRGFQTPTTFPSPFDGEVITRDVRGGCLQSVDDDYLEETDYNN